MIRFAFSTSSRASLRFLALAILLGLAVTGCKHVHPYERTKLAHPTMAAGSLNGAGEEHMFVVHEGAAGGSGGAESGCGCN